MRVLCVAEKPSASKKLAEVLSQNRYTTVNMPFPSLHTQRSYPSFSSNKSRYMLGTHKRSTYKKL